MHTGNADPHLRSQGQQDQHGKAIQDVRSREDQGTFRKCSTRQVRAKCSCLIREGSCAASPKAQGRTRPWADPQRLRSVLPP